MPGLKARTLAHGLGVLVLIALLLALTPAAVLAQDQPPRPGDPGARPEPPYTDPIIIEPPQPPPGDRQPDQGTSVAPVAAVGDGAQIQLSTTPGTVTVVQWQDGSGAWNDVTGWRATASSGAIVWYVEAKDFGKGPFRWVSYGADGYTMTGTSDAFYLPSAGGSVTVSINAAYAQVPGSYNYGYSERPGYGYQAQGYGTSAQYGQSTGYGYQAQGYAGYAQSGYATGGYAGGHAYDSQYGAYQSGYRSQAYQTQAYRGAYSCWCYYQGYWYYTCGR